MKKKAVSALLCATMVAGMLAGCGKGSDSGTPVSYTHLRAHET